jgi:hypothetical protein
MATGNDWSEHRLYVKKELERLATAVEDLTTTIHEQHDELAEKVTANSMLLSHIRAKMGVVGAIFGIIGGAVAAWALGVL